MRQVGVGVYLPVEAKIGEGIGQLVGVGVLFGDPEDHIYPIVAGMPAISGKTRTTFMKNAIQSARSILKGMQWGTVNTIR
jgi:hypothetical protein